MSNWCVACIAGPNVGGQYDDIDDPDDIEDENLYDNEFTSGNLGMFSMHWLIVFMINSFVGSNLNRNSMGSFNSLTSVGSSNSSPSQRKPTFVPAIPISSINANARTNSMPSPVVSSKIMYYRFAVFVILVLLLLRCLRTCCFRTKQFSFVRS